METQQAKGWRVPRSSDENDNFATKEAVHRWWLVETGTGGEEGKGEEGDVTFSTLKQLG